VSAVVIIDHGGGNAASVRYALERLGVDPLLTADPERIRCAARVILPGVGTARHAMARLTADGLDRLIPTLKQPLLGICLGMQLLFEFSAEDATICLGILKGVATRLKPSGGMSVPHVGWNQLERLGSSPLLKGVDAGDYAYFVHSYAVPVGPDTIATCDYGAPFTAMVSRGNFHGTQFHPERSAATGARLLANFLSL
jgi:glutamine amidotransferase